ncbi:MAG: NADH:flavin oxidoreductase/NADH oxidase [Candidatus Ozemobacter sibiricus]|jgi:2,4-dienoyl-CoA reductase-like NADH-dependent reductase (Old Yellow Enzyme family)|uniref:NADH:flavin oxidoreductase/NADH oxidase n=1 Tax=Candidatus Ozemobacter sibiricus TaxID=2268124 RepID=A0A367ZQD5_9BACT|nr:MAG: NADH:flavin oxidoreductase/NADH oxidase [Candidatus Ozemobacter sibiricus]
MAGPAAPPPSPATLWDPLVLPRLTLPHRVVRAATYDNLATPDGYPTAAQGELLAALACGGAGTIITGFAYVSRQGRALQGGQAGIDHDDKIAPWARVLEQVRRAEAGTKVLLQIAHTGRQTTAGATGRPVVGAGPVRCTYFLSPVRPLTEREIGGVVRSFVAAAERAWRAGFDGVQVHAAHGYLIHQFLSPRTNRRRDAYGADPLRLLREIVEGIRARTPLAILLKLSAGEDGRGGLTLDRVVDYARAIDAWEVDALEISYGTMEIPLNIIRGAVPADVSLRYNPLFRRWGRVAIALFRRFLLPWYKKRFLPFQEMYNVDAAYRIARAVRTPVLVTGGIRTGAQIAALVADRGLAGATLARPFIREPDFVARLRADPGRRSTCLSCNLCTVMCDSPYPLRCWMDAPADLRREALGE